MRWRLTVMIACLGGWLGASEAARLEPHSYRLEVRVTRSPAAPPAVMTCRLDRQCVGQIELRIDDKPQAVTVVVLVGDTSALVRLVAEQGRLFVGGQKYVYIPIGLTKTARLTIPVSAPTPDELEAAMTGLYRNPVHRRPARVVAEIEIDIRPSD